jgi:hypothetical protein
MKLKTLFTLHAVIALANGIAFLIVPVQYLGLFGIALSDPGMIVISRLFATALLAFGFVDWFARDAGPSRARDAIVLGFFLSIAPGFVVVLIGQLSGLMNPLGWALVALYLVMSAGYGYFSFVKPDADQ